MQSMKASFATGLASASAISIPPRRVDLTVQPLDLGDQGLLRFSEPIPQHIEIVVNVVAGIQRIARAPELHQRCPCWRAVKGFGRGKLVG